MNLVKGLNYFLCYRFAPWGRKLDVREAKPVRWRKLSLTEVIPEFTLLALCECNSDDIFT